MNQIRSDRDTKTHTLVQRGRSIISLLLFCSSFLVCISFCDILLDYYGLTKETCDYSPLQVGYWFFGKLCSRRGTFSLHSQVWLAGSTGMNGPTNAPTPHLLPLFYHLFWLFNSHSTSGPPRARREASSHGGSATIEALTKCILSLPDLRS